MRYLIKNISVFDSNSEIQTNQNIYIGKGKIENLSHNEKNITNCSHRNRNHFM